MTRLLAAFSSLRVTGWNLFRPLTTEPLPWKGDRARPERFRTSFALVHDEHGDEACIGCKMCEKICPSQIITVVAGGRKPSEKTGKPRGWATDFTLDVNACIHCELCVQVCPADAIVMLRVAETPGYSREDLFLSMEKLYANESHAHSWADGTKLIGMQEPPAAPKPAPKPAAEKPAAAEKPSATPSEAKPAVEAIPAVEARPVTNGDAEKPAAEAKPAPEPAAEPKGDAA